MGINQILFEMPPGICFLSIPLTDWKSQVNLWHQYLVLPPALQITPQQVLSPLVQQMDTLQEM